MKTFLAPRFSLLDPSLPVEITGKLFNDLLYFTTCQTKTVFHTPFTPQILGTVKQIETSQNQ